MTKENIAFSIAGVLALGGIGYLLYRHQQTSAAIAANNAAIAANNQVDQSAATYDALSSLPSLSIPSFSANTNDSAAASTTSDTPANEDTFISNLITSLVPSFNATLQNANSQVGMITALPDTAVTPSSVEAAASSVGVVPIQVSEIDPTVVYQPASNTSLTPATASVISTNINDIAPTASGNSVRTSVLGSPIRTLQLES